MTFQELVSALAEYWGRAGCLLLTPYNSEVGAGTMNPATFLRVLGPEPWKAAYIEPSKRPKDGRYGENPNRVQQFNQYQVILKPAPEDVLPLYVKSLEAIGIDPDRHDVRLLEDDWESPTLGASGLGWEVWLDGMEITQFTYFQQAGGMELDPIAAEITYGLERICMYIQGVDDIMDIDWGEGITWGELFRHAERDFSAFHFEQADTEMYFSFFERFGAEARRLLDGRLVLPAYDYVLKCSHIFNILDARGAISVSERTSYIARIRDLARRTAEAYIEERREAGFPLLAPRGKERR
ncbi:MAG: glycine--tRNA ligase subunit alpha [Candidatus Krumholzibacteriota bacterium]|nr:glycine--tRNA ligase subunit alpha [Candidatus Krumholzibacteriota bacterium]